MIITKTMVVLSAASLLAISGCVGKVPDFNQATRCDHEKSKQFTVNISVSKDKTQEPKVHPESVVACFGDEITFQAAGSEFNFNIEFNKRIPLKGNLRSVKGVAKTTVSVKPRADEEGYKYAVNVPGYPPRDPWIRIVTR